MANGVNNKNYDGSCSRIRWNLSSIGGLKSLDLPETTRKSEKIPLIGEVYSTVTTPGSIEVGEAVAVFTAVGWKEALGKLPDRYMEIEFPITTVESLVTIDGDYSTIMDRCSILKVKPGKIEGGEKGREVEVTFQVIMVHERGSDGKWKTAGRRPGEDPSKAAQALMF